MTPTEALLHLASLPPSDIKMGLERVQAALERLGSPQARVPAIQVAGTNGKGSTSVLVATCLGRRWRTGLYTSPHLARVNERFKVNGADITDEALGRCVARIVETLGREHRLTYFELGTLVAFHHFAQVGVDLAVLETGLGGRLDAATACVPVVTAITPIDFDHVEYLGSTIEAIAAEKAGIIKRGVPVVSSAQRPEALAVLVSAAARAGAELRLEGRDFHGTASSWEGRRWRLEGLELPLRGPHQEQNLSVALACLELVAERGFALSEEEVKEGIRTTRWPGRLEEIAIDPLVVLDGAHNPSGAEALVRALETVYAARPVHLVFGVFSDKDGESMMRTLFPKCAGVYLTPIDHPRSRHPESYLELAKKLCPSVERLASASEAVLRARSAAGTGIVVVAGSLALVGQVRRLLAGGGGD
jgi:dihydrofolate synthase / folylpolyglutamate synthase